MQRRLLLTAAVVLPLALAVTYAYTAATRSMAAAPITPTTAPLIFALFGATGRTGLPFLRQALERGHAVTAFTRSAAKVPAELVGHPRLTVVEVELTDEDRIAEAIAAARPDVVLTMLASDPAPHTAVSTGNRAAHNALRRMRDAAIKNTQGSASAATTAPAPAKPTPFILITGWGLGPTRPLVRRWYERALLTVATSTFYKPILNDFNTALADLTAPSQAGLIRPIQLMPPLLTSGLRTDTYEWGDALSDRMASRMHSLDTVSRASMAHLALVVAEKAAAGEDVPQYIALRQP